MRARPSDWRAGPGLSGGRQFAFLVVAAGCTHRSSGARALYRLCHHLNRAGCPTAMVRRNGRAAREILLPSPGLGGGNDGATEGGAKIGGGAPARPAVPLTTRIAGRVQRVFRSNLLPPWDVLGYRDPVGEAIAAYHGGIGGNPLRASKVVRWTLNAPGVAGATAAFPELAFAFDHQKLPDINATRRGAIGRERVVRVGLFDPSHICPDAGVPKMIDCSFTHKGEELRRRFPLDPSRGIRRLEDLTPSMAALGATLRDARTP